MAKLLLAAILGAGLFILSGPCHAALIVGAVDVPSTGRTPDIVGGPDVIYASEDLVFNSLSPIDTVFTIHSSGGTVESDLNQFLVNQSGHPWIGFELQLGTGTGSGFSMGLSGIQFAPPVNLSDPSRFLSDHWTSLTSLSADDVKWGSGTFSGADGEDGMVVSIDLADQGSSPSTFTLRQIPIVAPEPTSAVGMMVVMAMTLGRRFRRPL